jgi:anti-sigma factor RsiW
MTCVDFEVALADYCDDTLLPADRVALEAHAASCPGCHAFMQDAMIGFRAGRQLPAIPPPPDLITRLAHQAPLRRVRRPAEYQSAFSKVIERWFLPLIQPRWAMGMAMTMLSFGMLERCTGFQAQRLQAADLSPVRIWSGMENRALRVRDRSVKYYENIRLVYEVEMRLHQLETEQVTKSRQAPNGSSVNRSSEGKGTKK